MRVISILFLLFFTLSSLTVSKLQHSEEGESDIYVSRSGAIYQSKYAILEVKDTVAYLEVYSKYNGDVVPVNMSWNSKIDPEKYFLKIDSTRSNKKVFKGSIVEITVYEKHAHVSLKCSFMGGFELEFIKVNHLPEKFEHVRNHAYMFTGRNAVGYQFKTEGGYQSYDKFMEGNTLYKDCDQLSFHDFVSKYDSVQKRIFKEVYSIHDSLKIHSVLEKNQEE